MNSIKQIKTRIKSVKSTKKVTKTMELISAVKLQKAVDYALNIKKYRDEFEAVSIRSGIDFTKTELFKSESREELLIVVSTDRGLAGSFNGNLRRFISQYYEDRRLPVSVILIGKKLFGFLKKMRMNLESVYKFSDFNETEDLADVVFKDLKKMMSESRVGKAKIIFTQFLSLSEQNIIARDLIPASDDSEEYKDVKINDILMESSKEEIEEYIVSEHIRLSIHSAISESLASEHLSRMIAMKNATEASQEIIDALLLEYNKTRQANITKEIIEIISGMQEDESDKTCLDITNKILLNL